MRNNRKLYAIAIRLACLAAALLPVPAVGADFLKKEDLLATDRRVEVWAQKVSRDVDRQVTVGEGAVDVRSGEVRLRADKVELNEKTMDMTASGHVVLEAGQDRLQGEYMEFNMRTEVGYVMDGQGFSQAYYFTGKRIDKLPDDTYVIKSGTFTSCEGVVPDWSFHSPKTTIHVNHYIYSWHPSLWVKKVPVFYVPYAVVPIKKDRSTGLLAPHLRYSEVDGFIVQNSFFWAPLDNADATFQLDYFSRRGWRYGLESNYILAEETSGHFQGYFIRDRMTGRDRWDLSYLHRQDLPWSFSGLVNVNFLSDRQYQETYAEDLEDISAESMESSVSVSRDWGRASLVVSGQQRESLAAASRSTLSRLPEANFRVVEGRIGEGPLFWSLDTSAVGLRLDRDGAVTRTGRVDMAPSLSWPMNLESWAALKPSVRLEYTYYTRDAEGDPAQRFVYNPRLDLTGPKFYRIYGDPGGGPLYKHTVTPKVYYSFRPEIDQEELLYFDGVDRVGPDNSVTYALANQVLGKFQDESGKSFVREVLKLEFSQRYTFDPVVVNGEKKYLGDLRMNLTARPAGNLLLESDAYWDFSEDRLASLNYGFQWYPKPWSLSLERRYSHSGVDYLEGMAGFQPGSWGLTFRSRYDLENEQFVENFVEVKYASQCWDVILGYVRRENGYEFRFVLNFKEIGAIIKI